MCDNEINLLELYDISIRRENYYVVEHQKRIAFYLGLLTALTGGTVAGLFKSQTNFHFIIMSFGPILIIVVAITGMNAIKYIYRRWLEEVTFISKLSYDLGFYESRNDNSVEKKWLINEPYVPVRHFKSANNTSYKSTEEWVNGHINKRKSYQGATNKLFVCAIFAGFLLLAFLLIIVIFDFATKISI